MLPAYTGPMRKLRLPSWLLVGTGLVCSTLCGARAYAAQADCPAQVRLAYTDAALPPYVLGSGDVIPDPPGLFVQWARAALRKLGCRSGVTEVRLPYNRIVNSLTEGSVDFRVTGGYRPELASIMVFPMEVGAPMRAMAVAEARTMLYVLQQNPGLSWDGRALVFTGSSRAVGTVRGHFTEKLLQSMNWPVDSAPTWESNAKKLLLGRVAAVVGPDSVVDALPERSQLQPLEPPIAVDLYFAPASVQFYKAYPQFTHRFWLEICRESRARFRHLPACTLPAAGQDTGR